MVQRNVASGEHGAAGAAAPVWLAGALAVYLLAGAATAPGAFFSVGGAAPWWPGLPVGPLAAFSLAAAVGIVACAALDRRGRVLLPVALLLISQAAVAAALFSTTGGAALYQDDHPSFMYRFWSFARVFPQLVYYDPFWNGGGKSAAFIASGIVPLGLLFWPIWRWVPILASYTPVLAAVFIGAVPWVIAGSVRLAGGGWGGGAVAGILALGVCRVYLVHLLHFGTVGSLFSSVFIVPVVVALHRAIWQQRRDRGTAAVLVGASLVFLSWPGSAFSAALLVGVLLINVKRVVAPRTLGFLGLCALAILVALAPMLNSLLRHADIAGVATVDRAKPVAIGLLLVVWQNIGDLLRQGNPLLLIFGVLGAGVLKAGWRSYLVPLLGGLLLLAAGGDLWKPTLQFSRLIIPFFLIACVPAGLLCGRLFETPGRRQAVAGGLVLALAAMSTFAVTKHYDALTGGPYGTFPAPMRDLVSWIRSTTDPGERILFAGPTVHGFGAGHVALLPVLTGREMLAGDYYAFSPQLVESELPPSVWRRGGIEGVRRYLDLHRVGWCLTYHERWKKYFRRYPEFFEEVASFPETTLTITAFRVRTLPPAFYAGSGTAQALPGTVEVRLDTPAAAVVRYRWVDGLVADGGVQLSPHPVGNGLTFIRAEPAEKLRFSIRYR